MPAPAMISRERHRFQLDKEGAVVAPVDSRGTRPLVVKLLGGRSEPIDVWAMVEA